MFRTNSNLVRGSHLSKVSILANRYTRTSRRFDILCERYRPYRCRRAAVVQADHSAQREQQPKVPKRV